MFSDSPLQTHYLFAGEYLDTDLNQTHLRARFLKSEVGRFSTVDPFEGQQKHPISLHKYLYADVQPTSKTDPSGKITCTELVFVTGVIGVLFGDSLYRIRLGETGEQYSVANHFGYVISGGLLGMGAGLILIDIVGASMAVGSGGLALQAPKGTESLTAAQRLRFAQNTASETFTTIKKGSDFKFAGHTIDSVASGLKSGAVLPEEVPVSYLVRNGNTLIVNTRSFIANMRGGISPDRMKFVNVTGDVAEEIRITERLANNKLTDAGSLVVRLRNSSVVDLSEALR